MKKYTVVFVSLDYQQRVEDVRLLGHFDGNEVDKVADYIKAIIEDMNDYVTVNNFTEEDVKENNSFYRVFVNGTEEMFDYNVSDSVIEAKVSVIGIV